ncbi:MAG TPA: tetratricopeptide repeat protein [Sphingomicrobium sp.]
MNNKSKSEKVSVGEALVHARRLLSSHPQRAADQARAVIRAEPGIAEAYLLLAIALRISGKLDEAQLAEQTAIDCAQRDPVIERATAQVARGDYAAADRLLSLYLTDTPNDPVAIYLRGQVQLGIGQAQEARRLFRRSLALAPSFDAARKDLEALPAEADGDTAIDAAGTVGHGLDSNRFLDEEPWFTSEWDSNSASGQTDSDKS